MFETSAGVDEETATRSLTLAQQDLTKEFIFQQASQKLAPEAALKLADAMGLVKKGTLEAVQAMDLARAKYDTNRDGILQASEAARGYVTDIGQIAQAIQALQDKNVTVTVKTINDYIDKFNQATTGHGDTVNLGRPQGGTVASAPAATPTVAQKMRNRGLTP